MRVLSCSSSVACFRTSALFYCSQQLALVLVAWCRTFHERSLCSLRRVLVKSCPVACYSCSSGTTTATTQLCSAQFCFSHPPTPGIYDAGLPHPPSPPHPMVSPPPPLWGGACGGAFPRPPCGFVVVVGCTPGLVRSCACCRWYCS